MAAQAGAAKPDAAAAAGGAEEEPVQLQHAWKVFERRKPQGDEGRRVNLIELTTFNNIRDFWLVWQHLPRISDIFTAESGPSPVTRQYESGTVTREVSGYTLTRANIKPSPTAEIGGRRVNNFSFTSDNRIRGSRDMQDFVKIYERLVLLVISGRIPGYEAITGVNVYDKSDSRGGKGRKSRPQIKYRITVWVREKMPHPDFTTVLGLLDHDTDLKLDTFNISNLQQRR